jgi:hypothetical protein
MRRDEWARLAVPFPAPALDWCVAQLDSEGSTARLEPVVSEPAVVERLDQVLGIEGWSMRLVPLGPDAVVCELELLGVHKTGVARSFGGQLAMDRVCAWAMGRAAGRCGMRPPSERGAWVDFDFETGEPVVVPEIGIDADHDAGPEFGLDGPRAEGRAGAGRAGAARDGAGPAGAGRDGGVEAGGAEIDGVEAGRFEAGGVEAGGVEAVPSDGGAFDARQDGEPAPDTGPARSEGQQVIERLVERLRAEGLGREAATLVVEHGGYGRSPEEARELYRRLRELLLERGTAS